MTRLEHDKGVRKESFIKRPSNSDEVAPFITSFFKMSQIGCEFVPNAFPLLEHSTPIGQRESNKNPSNCEIYPKKLVRNGFRSVVLSHPLQDLAPGLKTFLDCYGRLLAISLII
jgi:hypothetical protein